MTTLPLQTADEANAEARASALLNPRFYTTDFAAMDRIDVSALRAEWDAMLAEYEGDNNHDHFQRDAAFADEVKAESHHCKTPPAAGPTS